jgi:hypothetical protein
VTERKVLALSMWVSKDVCVHVRPRMPAAEGNCASCPAKDWLDVRAGDTIQVFGAPTKVLRVSLSMTWPRVQEFPDITCGREWEQDGTTLRINAWGFTQDRIVGKIVGRSQDGQELILRVIARYDCADHWESTGHYGLEVNSGIEISWPDAPNFNVVEVDGVRFEYNPINALHVLKVSDDRGY